MDSNIDYLEKRIADLENKLESLQNDIPQSGIMSDSFIKRAFTIFGHNLTAGLMIMIPFYLLFFIFGMLFFKSALMY